jgi:hypothetical protein
MADGERIELPRLILTLWGRLMMEKRFHAAAMAGLLGHLVSHETGDKDLEAGATDWITKAMDELRAERSGDQAAKGQPACSFCGRSEPEVRLAAGPGVFICDSCVGSLNQLFTSEK